MDNRPIGIYDSGVGGLSIFREIRKKLPRESVIYFGDTGNCPYGIKEAGEIKNLADQALSFLISKDVKLVVVACNTVTVTAIEDLRQKFQLPIVGMVPVVKTAAEVTKNKKIGILCTPLTARSDSQKDLIEKFARGMSVSVQATPELVQLVEAGQLEGPLVRTALTEALEPLKKKNVDVIALGCSHFPFLRKEIEDLVGPEVKVLDSGGAIARRVEAVLESNGQLAESSGIDSTQLSFPRKRESKNFYRFPIPLEARLACGGKSGMTNESSGIRPIELKFFTSGDPEKFKKVAEKLIGGKIVVTGFKPVTTGLGD